MNSVINLGIFSIHIYSLCILAGVLIAYFIIVKEAQKHGYDKQKIDDLIFYVLISGIIGARLYYCIFNLDYYVANPIDIIKIWEGGLAIHGGIIGGLIAAFIYCKKQKYNMILILDFIVVGLILAQAIGRWGNFFNGEAHGPITTLSHLESLYLPRFIIDGMYINGNYYIPTFLYESLWCFIGFILMIFIRKNKRTKIGYLLSFYLIWYGVERFFVESLRTDSLMFFSLKIAQFVSLFMIIIGIVLFIYSYKKAKYYLERDE